MELSDSDARALVAELQEKNCSGADDLELITWLSNKYRIAKRESRAVYDDYYLGFQRGADSIVPIIDGRAVEPAACPDSSSTVYRAAYSLGQEKFTEEFAASLERNRPRGCLPILCFSAIATMTIYTTRVALRIFGK